MRFTRFLSFVFGIVLCGVAATAAAAPMDKVYLVVGDSHRDAASGIVEYLKDNGAEYALVQPADMAGVQDKPYFIVIGSPRDNDETAALAQRAFTPKQWADAREMGRAGVVVAKVDKSEVMFFFSDYALKTLVAGTEDRWAEMFSDWYDIPLSITLIIGY